MRGGSSPSLMRLRVETDVRTVNGVAVIAVLELLDVLVRAVVGAVDTEVVEYGSGVTVTVEGLD